MSRPLRVLIVEDSENDAQLIVYELRNGGYEPAFERVETRQAMKAGLDKNIWDIIISDFVMPNFDGIAALRLLKESSIDIPLIIVSGAIGEDVAVKAMKAGANDYIMKDNLKRLVPAIEREMQEAEERRQRRQAELKLRKSEARFTRILDVAQDAIISSDEEQKIIVFNKGAERVFGYSSNEVIGKSIDILIPEKVRTDWQSQIKRFGKSNEIAEQIGDRPVQIFGLRKNGKEFPAEVTISKFKEDDKTMFIAVLRDITERKRIEEELLNAQKLESLAILAGGIAHDFNNILTVILGNIDLAMITAKPEEKIYDSLSRAEKATIRAKELTQQLLTFSKGGTPVKKTASITELIKESTEFALRGSNVKCELSIPDGIWPVDIDVGQMNQVLNNLVINAVHAMPEGGAINVKLENVTEDNIPPTLSLKKGRYVKISVKDHGIGIKKEHLNKIFDPYFTTKQKGSGLGLASAYSIIKRHDGLISVESQLGIGTTFNVYIPASSREVVEKKELEEHTMIGSGKILVMDDEETIRRTASQMLHLIGYETELARDGTEALELYENARVTNKPFDIVILDLTVRGGIGGNETIKKLLERVWF